jgi:hypothetical protein
MGTIVGGTWSFSGDPASSDKDAVRFMIRDVDQSDQLFSDQEIDFAISTEGSKWRAAAMLCEQLAASCENVDRKIGDLAISGSQRAAQYRMLAKRYRYRGSMTAGVFAGGISHASKEKYKVDTDINQPAFYRGMTDYPNTFQDGDGLTDPSTADA